MVCAIDLLVSFGVYIDKRYLTVMQVVITVIIICEQVTIILYQLLHINKGDWYGSPVFFSTISYIILMFIWFIDNCYASSKGKDTEEISNKFKELGKISECIKTLEHEKEEMLKYRNTVFNISKFIFKTIIVSVFLTTIYNHLATPANLFIVLITLTIFIEIMLYSLSFKMYRAFKDLKKFLIPGYIPIQVTLDILSDSQNK